MNQKPMLEISLLLFKILKNEKFQFQAAAFFWSKLTNISAKTQSYSQHNNIY